MHTQRIIQDFLANQCPSMHAKRRHGLAVVTEGARRGGLGLLKMSKAIAVGTPLRYRIKRVDLLLSNPHLASERVTVFRALAHRLLQGKTEIGVIVDWSDLLSDVSQHLLRAAIVVQGRAFVIVTILYRSQCAQSVSRQTAALFVA